MTLHQLFLKHGNALECAKLARELSTPELGVSEFGAFCKVIELLDTPAQIEFRDTHGTGNWLPTFYGVHSVAKMLRGCFAVRKMSKTDCRVVLLDGTVIREWGAS